MRFTIVQAVLEDGLMTVLTLQASVSLGYPLFLNGMFTILWETERERTNSAVIRCRHNVPRTFNGEVSPSH